MPSAGPSEWSVADVGSWLAELELPEAVIASFKENAISGPDLLDLSDEDLKEELGCKPLQARKIRTALTKMGFGKTASAVTAAAAEPAPTAAAAAPVTAPAPVPAPAPAAVPAPAPVVEAAPAGYPAPGAGAYPPPGPPPAYYAPPPPAQTAPPASNNNAGKAVAAAVLLSHPRRGLRRGIL